MRRAHCLDDIDDIHTLPRAGCPVLLVHDRDDPVIPACQGACLGAL